MAKLARNLLQGSASVYVGNFGALEPADTAINTAPAASAWTEVGLTTGGVTLNLSEEYAQLEADQIADRAGSALVSRNATITTSMSEITLENLALALNTRAANITTGATWKKFVPASSDIDEFIPNYKAILLWGNAPASAGGNVQKRMVIIRRVLSTEGVEYALSRTDQTVLPVTFTGHYVSDVIKPWEVKEFVAAS